VLAGSRELEGMWKIDFRTPKGPRMDMDSKPRQRAVMSGAFSPEQVEDLKHAQLWEMGITELAGHNTEARGREELNKMLQEGWVLLHIYTLQYNDDGVWRQRPMAILGRSTRGNR